MGDRFCEPIFRFLRIRKIRPFVSPDSVLLDVGCGEEGTLLKDLSPFIREGIGIDVRAKGFEEKNIRVQQGSLDGVPIPFPSGSVDCVTLLAVLEHMEHREELLKEIYRVLKPGGVLLLTVPTWPAKPVLEFLAYRLKVVSDEAIREHKTYFWKKELRDILSLVQFKPEMTQVRYFELGFNLFAAARK